MPRLRPLGLIHVKANLPCADVITVPHDALSTKCYIRWNRIPMTSKDPPEPHQSQVAISTLTHLMLLCPHPSHFFHTRNTRCYWKAYLPGDALALILDVCLEPLPLRMCLPKALPSRLLLLSLLQLQDTRHWLVTPKGTEQAA